MSSILITSPESSGLAPHEASPVEASGPICPNCGSIDAVKHGTYTRNPARALARAGAALSVLDLRWNVLAQSLLRRRWPPVSVRGQAVRTRREYVHRRVPRKPSGHLHHPAVETLTVVGDSSKYCHLVPGILGLDRRIRADRVPAMSLNRTDTLGELVDDNHRLLG